MTDITIVDVINHLKRVEARKTHMDNSDMAVSLLMAGEALSKISDEYMEDARVQADCGDE